MGFDIYGLNPKGDVPKPVITDWKDDSLSFEEQMKAYESYQKETPGSYFRANVWFWRPIWNFVCAACDDFLSEDDMDAGDSNSGDRICKTKANRIASRLRKLDKQGIIQTWEDEMLITFNEAKEHNKAINEEMDIFQDKMRIKYGSDVVPYNYDVHDKTTWDSIYRKRSWASSYPPSRDEVVRFGIFCGESGGFEIC